MGLKDKMGEVVRQYPRWVSNKLERKNMRTNIALHSTIFNQMKDLIFLIKATEDNLFIVTEVNQAFLDETGYIHEEVIGREISELVGQSGTLFSVEMCREAIAEKTTIQYESTLLQPLVSRTYEIALHPVIEREGTGYITGVVRNITKRLRQEEKQRNTEKMLVVSHLAAGVAHELRNPLTSIKGFLKLLKDQVSEQDTSLEFYLNIMSDEFIHIEQVVDELVKLSLPHSLLYSETHIPLLIEETIKSFQELQVHLEATIQLHFHYYGCIPPVSCDRSLVKKVLLHLLTNASESMLYGGEIFITTYVNEQKEVCISIIDEGKGIAQDRLKRLGEPYYSTKEKGTGFGLTMCYQVIKQHQGRIVIHSEENEGTIVTVALPVHPKKQLVPKEPEEGK
ncbi:two-component system sensor histidine kinase NtrB [Brevibacillus daliensis]|uniref:two-component system sensor histidine kinase NtrB n=1 Tax=Brevibacillus daliensis TaxID=2892995 RepID=UPI001E56E32B|nr:ATP-binding protein [Brevibacillus daliensis]